MEEKRLGNIYGFDGGNYAGNVYSKERLSPTIRTFQGGNQQPMIVAENIPCKLNKMPNGHLDSLDNAEICDVGTETSSTVTARYYKGIGAHKDNMCIVAMRGRNPDNPSDRTVGSPTEQRLEPNSQGICNTLTSVQKDNMVLENICINDRGFLEKEPQVSIGTAPTLRAETHGNLPKVIENQPISTKGKPLDVASTILNGYHRTNMTGFNADNGVLVGPQYRIRKLTPLECWRLMGFSDEDFRKAEEVNSNSQLYKQAGNSIVKNVLMAILGQMIPGEEDVYKEI